ncbi:MAG: tRNA (adenine-N1)-methyltransferase [Thermoprotei archaeon]
MDKKIYKPWCSSSRSKTMDFLVSSSVGGKVSVGDMVLLILDVRRKYLIKVREGGELHTHKGIIKHSDLIGMPYGSSIVSSMGYKFYVARPMIRDYIEKFARRTQIIYPKDAAYILMIGNIGPGSRVVEAGTGSGALTCMLANVVRPDGHVYSYEIREEFLKEAEKNIEKAGLKNWVTLKLQDITKGIDERDLDAVILDMPDPWLVVSNAKKSLKGAAPLISFLPTTNQIMKLLPYLKNEGFFDIHVVELIEREYQPEPEKLRPRNIIIGHTGYIVYARASHA